MSNTKSYAMIALAVLLIAISNVGCSGGGGDDSGGGDGEGGNVSSGQISGIFVDNAVEGLKYETSTQSGITNVQGTFQYVEGETITFSIGDIILGQAIAKATMTPLNFVSGTLNVKNPTVTNIARFLLSLDLDNDWDNGLSISEGTRNECFGRIIDFNQSIAEFEKDPEVQNLFDTLNALGLFVDVRKLCSTRQAQKHLAETIEEYIDKWIVTQTEIDQDNDGTIDQVEYYTYDANGNLIKYEMGSGSAEWIFRAEYYTYDTNGNLIKYEVGSGNVGTIYRTEYYTYDTNGNLIESEIDTDNDGTTDQVGYHAYDSNGDLIKSEFVNTDYGIIEKTEYYTYDANGNKIEVETLDTQVNDHWSSYKYDTKGNRISASHYIFKVGTYYEYTYDANGYLIKAEVVSQVSVDTYKSIEYYTYDANGNLIMKEEDRYRDGTIDAVIYYTYQLK